MTKQEYYKKLKRISFLIGLITEDHRMIKFYANNIYNHNKELDKITEGKDLNHWLEENRKKYSK